MAQKNEVNKIKEVTVDQAKILEMFDLIWCYSLEMFYMATFDVHVSWRWETDTIQSIISWDCSI